MNRTLHITAVAVAVLLLRVASADAADLYIDQYGSGGACSQAAPCIPNTALFVAERTPSTLDRIHVVGRLSYSALDLTTSPIELIGSGTGIDGTTLKDSQLAPALHLGSGSSASGVAVKGSSSGVWIEGSGALRDSTVAVGSGRAIFSRTRSAADAPVIERVRVESPNGGGVLVTAEQNAGPGNGARLTVSDSFFVAKDTGIDSYGPAVAVNRTRIEAANGILTNGGASTVTNSVIRAGERGIGLYSDASAFVRGSTVDGSGGLTGFYVSATTRTAPVLLENSVVRGFANDVQSASTQLGALSIRNSDFHAPNGLLYSDAGGNIDVDPRFRNAPNGDFRLRGDSPLIDAGTGINSNALGDFDASGDARVVDGDGDGRALPDIGAYERALLRPNAVIADTTAIAGVPVILYADRSTYAAGAITHYEWDLDGDGSYETDGGAAPKIAHTFAGPGNARVSVRITGWDGAIGTATATVAVFAAPGNAEPAHGDPGTPADPGTQGQQGPADQSPGDERRPGERQADEQAAAQSAVTGAPSATTTAPMAPAPIKPLTVSLPGGRLTISRAHTVVIATGCSAKCSITAILTANGRTLGRVNGAAGKLRVRLSRHTLAFIATKRIRRVTLTVSALGANGKAQATRSYRLVA